MRDASTPLSGDLRGAGVCEGFDSVPQGGEHQKDLFNLGDLENLEHPLVYPGKGDAPSRFRARRASADQRAQAGRIEIRNAREVENHSWRSLAAHSVQEWSDILHREWTAEAQHSPVQPLDFQRL